MCGIAGILVTNPADLDARDLSRLGRALAHRGPDGEGIWTRADGACGLVHRRLAILDVSRLGDQPMHSADGRFTIVYNGEIFNFVELRDELIAKGVRFRSESDTEVILEAWRQWGRAMLPRFNGMWAMALLDSHSGELFIARDRFGIKPLLYTQSDGRFAFASEMRALVALPWLERRLDQEVATRLLFDPFSIEGGERSLLTSIRRLPAGHCGTVRGGRVSIERWWRTSDNLVAAPATAELQSAEFRRIFLDATRLRLRSDVAVGTCLSGGFDSSAITGAMAHVAQGESSHIREAQDWRHAFIASFPGFANDETPQALEAATFAGVTPHVLALSDEDALSQIDMVLRDLDDVYISLPTAPWLIYRELRRAHTVVSLDGHGADELMGGYRQQGQAVGFLMRNIIAGAANRHKAVGRISECAKAAILATRGLNFLRHHRIAAPADLGTPFDDDPLPSHWGAFNRRLYRMFHATVLPTILRNFDRLSMAHGVEVRMPFMDWRLVTYVMSLPDEAKSAQGMSKFVARQAMAGLMPESIRLARRKVGFNSPMPEWLNGPLREWVATLLNRESPAFDEIVDTVALRRKVAAVSDAKAWDWHTVGRLWPYIHLKWWLHQYL